MPPPATALKHALSSRRVRLLHQMSDQVTLDCARDSVCMGDDMMAPNPKSILISPSLTDPVALGQLLSSDYLPLVAGDALSWELQLNSVPFARVTYASEGVPVVHPLVDKCQFSDDGSNAVYCKYHAAAAPSAAAADGE